MDKGKREHPPKPCLAIRVGVTGHRSKALKDMGVNEEKLAGAIKTVLAKIQQEANELFARNADVYGGGPSLQIISALAEGSDRFVAQAALEMQYELQCPLPFPQNVYEQTFTDTDHPEGSIAEFRDLLAKKRVLVMDGTLGAETQAYEAVGRLVLRHSDVLISIWDGHPPKPGGTGQITAEALQRKIPTVWIHPGALDAVRLLTSVSETGEANQSSDFESEISKRLQDALSLPSEEEVEALKRFYGEHDAKRIFAVVFSSFYKLMRWRPKRADLEDKGYAPAVSEETLETQIQAPPSLATNFDSTFSWADRLANLYADRHRSSFLTLYLLGACAVLTAFLGYSYNPGWFKVELLIIISILTLVAINRSLHWHDRWIDYRILAEWFRQILFLYPFARVTPTLKVPAYLGEDDPGPTWFNWLFRAFIRQAGLAGATVDRDYVKACRKILDDSITDQRKYHKDRSVDINLIHHRLHGLTLVAFGLTLLACLAHLFFEGLVEHLLGHHTRPLLTAVAIVAPAFGAAFEGINHQGEFERISRRSKSIKSRLDDLAKQIHAGGTQLSFRELGKLAEEFCEIQISEQTDWRSVFVGKEVNPT